jgi:NDP-sugar pyrophosphorylase family protein
MRGMLVAAGFGTRLHPLTAELPKPALPVGNRPVAAFALEHLVRFGVREVVCNTHHLGGELQRALEPCCPSQARLRFVHEPSILGTGGGVRNAWQAIGPQDGEDLIVISAKLVYAPDLARALDIHRRSGAIATMLLRALPLGSSFAAVEHEPDGRVRRIRGLPSEPSTAALAPAMFCSVQILSARALPDLPLDGDIIEHAYLKWLARGERVQGVLDDAPWVDVGVSLAHYLEANLALASGALRWPEITPLASGSLIEPDVRVPDDARFTSVVLGAGVQLERGTQLERVVAWPGARVPRGLRDAIVTSTHAVVPTR